MAEDTFDLPKLWHNFVHMPFRHKAFWFLAIFLTFLTIRDTVNLIGEYLDDPKKADMNMVLNETITLPNITFCIPTKQVLSHFPHKNGTAEVRKSLEKFKTSSDFLTKRWSPELTLHAFQSLAALFTVEREQIGSNVAKVIQRFGHEKKMKWLVEKREGVEFWMKELEARNVTFEQFMQKAGSEALKKSIKRMVRITKDDDDAKIIIQTKITWISRTYACFQPTYDEKNYKDIADQGTFFFLQVEQNKDNENTEDNKECITVDFHGNPYDWSRYSEGGGTSRDGFHDNLCPGLRHDVTVEVRHKYDMLENDEPGTSCRDFSDEDEDEFECRSRCRMEMVRQLCHCTPITTKYLVTEDNELDAYPLCDYSNCSLDVQKQSNRTETKCTRKCFRDCHQQRYSVSVDQKVSVSADAADEGRVRTAHLTSIYLLWGSFEYIEVTQSRVYTTASFIGELGGVIGMWLGLSILSLIQMMTWATEKLFVKATYVAKDVVDELELKHGKVSDTNGKNIRRRQV